MTCTVPPNVISMVPEFVADKPKVRVPEEPDIVSTEPALNLSIPGPAEPPPAPIEIVFATALLTSTVTVAPFLMIMPSVASGTGDSALQLILVVTVRAVL